MEIASETSEGESMSLEPSASSTQNRLTDEQMHAALALSAVGDDANQVSLAAEAAKIRDLYQKLNAVLSDQVTRVSEERGEGSETRIADLKQKLREICGTFEKVHSGKELAADAQVLETVSKLGFMCVEKLQRSATGRVFNGTLFAKKLYKFVNGTLASDDGCQDQEGIFNSWCKFAVTNYSKIARTVPVLSALKPVLTVDRSYVHQRKKRTRNEAEKVDAVHLGALNIEDVAVDENANLTRQLDNVYSCLKRRLRSTNTEQIGFYEFCLDPCDFARSVENIFYVSFLIKEMRVKIMLEANFPQIACVSASERERLHADDRTKSRTNQGVVSISYQQWKELIRLLNITEPAIKSL